MKQLISRRSFLKAAGVTAAAASMAIGAPAASACWLGDKSDVTILYTNDVHTYIDKQSPKLTYAAIADLKQSYQNAGKDVLLVDAGDHVQGTAYGSMDEGASIIKLMNAAGYDVATPGNHEFDYGMDRAKAIMKEADFPYLSCNWVDLRTGLRVLPSVKVFVRGGRRIAFVGVTTPETFTKSTPAYFMDKAQRKYIYDIQGGEDGKKLYDAVQKAIDKAKLLADVVIGLGHLGVDPSSSPWTSKEVIEHTSGFDAFIDGHSHTKMECEWVKDLSGKAADKTALQNLMGLNEEPNTPIIAMVSRLVSHKGLDLLREVMGDIMELPAQFVVLGSGDAGYEEFFRRTAERYPGRMAVRLGYNEALSMAIYAGADLFLMPSRSEPCGLSQMIAMRYGAVPIVRRTGDSVHSCQVGQPDGTGYLFEDYDAGAMLSVIGQATGLYRGDRAGFDTVRYRGMTADFSWGRSAAAYRHIYENL